MPEEKTSSIGTMIVVAIAAGLIGYVIGKPAPQQVHVEKPDPPEKPAELEEPKEPAFIKEGLVAYYPFNGNAKDESGNGHDGEEKGLTPSQDRHSNVGSAYEFNSEGAHIVIRQPDTLKMQKMTFNAWVYLSEEGANVPWTILRDGAGFQWCIDNAGKRGARNFLGVARPGVWHNAQYRGRLPTGEWFMYSATYDGSTLRQHLNAKEICSLALKGPVYYTPLPDGRGVVIGGPAWDGKPNLKNKLDDFRIYNRALSEGQVKALYEFEKPKE